MAGWRAPSPARLSGSGTWPWPDLPGGTSALKRNVGSGDRARDEPSRTAQRAGSGRPRQPWASGRRVAGRDGWSMTTTPEESAYGRPFAPEGWTTKRAVAPKSAQARWTPAPTVGAVERLTSIADCGTPLLTRTRSCPGLPDLPVDPRERHTTGAAGLQKRRIRAVLGASVTEPETVAPVKVV